jgi:hypothetical protein
MSDRGHYVRPPLVAREPAPRWHSVWRFRLAALVIILMLAWLVLVIARHFVNTEQNPGFGTAPAPSISATLIG